MEVADWTEKFILCIEKRPALYDKSIKGYSDRNVKETLWQQVYSEVVPNWVQLTLQEQINKGMCVRCKALFMKLLLITECKHCPFLFKSYHKILSYCHGMDPDGEVK